MARVVTIARTLGAGGESIGQRLATALGYRLLDNEIITRAAESAGVTPDMIARTEARQPLLVRILERMAVSGAFTPETGAIVMPEAIGSGLEPVIIDVVRAVADEGSAVIVAHGAGIALANRDDTLRVLVTASAETRAARVGNARAVSDSDKARRDFFERFFRLREEQPTHYDLVLNTDHVSEDAAVAALLTLARA